MQSIAKLWPAGAGLWLAFLAAVGCAAGAGVRAGRVTGQGGEGEVVVGAIRWDAHVGDLAPYGTRENNALGPHKWHSRLPFYAKVLGEDTVSIVSGSQAVMDREIAYAAAAGLDYFAFLLYDNDPASWGYPLGISLSFYLSSRHKDKVNFAVILPNPKHITGDRARWIERFVGYFRNPSYQTVLGGRPLVYTFRWQPWEGAAEMLAGIETACSSNGVPEPYFVDLWYHDELCPGCDAISCYAAGGAGEEGSFPYANLTAFAEARWQRRVDAGVPLVPLATAGWNGEPRLEYPDPGWSSNTYARVYAIPTPGQLAAHVGKAIDFVKAHPRECEARAVLVYAWNEFSEGGWLCPGLPDYEGAARLKALAPLLGGPGFRRSTLALWR